ncbi:ubiquinone biosynthesis monooxygenase COQ6, mitochondrial [Pectinophora gossypiella]|uniref:ubiquinone biosynthesis monooxygenase COQ6, mitochondrial n=1 Tax=Pectinophora gossypiella TaxID=13191 RepID=UPI00214EADF7|nr:ubiquinone biosynthesis monooxygenase COQ6, mitochondrial [Pectinophora gossypiella]
MLLCKIINRNFVVLSQVKTSTRAISAVRKLSTKNDGVENFKGKYDIIIAGGGMVGCTLACALGKNKVLSNLKILLLEGSPNKKYELKEEYSNRVVALNPSTKALMSSLDVWMHVENARLQPVRHMQVWDACSDAIISFNSTDFLDDDLAYIVENDLLQHSINTELSKVQNVHIVYGAKIADYELSKTQPDSYDCTGSKVKMSNGDTYSCQLLIGADGANSSVRKAIGAQYLAWNYDQMGVVATLHLAEETENTTAWQRFLPTGPVALLPLDSRRSSLVWSTTHEQAKQLLKLPDEQFVDSLNDALWKQYPRSSSVDACTSWVSSWLQRVGLPSGAARQLPPSVRNIAANSRAAFPLGFGHSTRYVAPGVALVGDAAHRVHPLAGQGVNLGFGDVKDLTELLANTLYSGLDLTHPTWLERYESLRQRHNVPTQLAIDALHRLYTVDSPPLVLLRSIGLQITNAIHPVKKMIMSHATT